MKVLMLVLSSNKEPVYEQHRQVWRTYMKSHPDVECYFIEFSPLVFMPTLTKDTLYVRGTENYYNITRKTMLALEYFLSKSSYDFVIRTNMSSVWIFPKMLTFLHTLPRTLHYGGVVLTHERVPFVSGTCITMSYDVAKILLQHKGIAYANNLVDDVDIGVALYHAGIYPVSSIPRVDISPDEDIYKEGFHYRVRFFTRRERELPIMRSLAAHNHS
jgi:hypothetical protein